MTTPRFDQNLIYAFFNFITEVYRLHGDREDIRKTIKKGYMSACFRGDSKIFEPFPGKPSRKHLPENSAQVSAQIDSFYKEDNFCGKRSRPKVFVWKIRSLTLFLGDVVGSSGNNSTSVGSPGEFHETVLAPSGSPGVFDDPILFATLRTVSDEHNSVVDLSGASGVVVDTPRVAGEVGIFSVEGYCDGTVGGESTSQSVFVMSPDLLEVEVFQTDAAADRGAFSVGPGVARSVRVLLLMGKSIRKRVIDGEGRISTSATEVHVLRISVQSAINELLFGEIEPLPGVLHNSGLDGSNRGESVARSTASLVLDRGDGLPSPVHGFWSIGHGNLGNRSVETSSDFFVYDGAQLGCSDFGISQIRERIQAQEIGNLSFLESSVVRLDLMESRVESLETSGFHRGTSVLFAMSSLEATPLGVEYIASGSSTENE